jgi:maleate isomerase
MPNRAAFLTGTAAAMLAATAGASARRLGTVGMIKPTHAPGSLEDISLFLPPGVAMDPVYLGVTRGTRAEFASAIPAYEKLVALLADQRCDVISAEGAPPFMIVGYAHEGALVRGWEKKYKTSIFTSSQNQVSALRALGVKKFVGVTPLARDQSPIYAKYFKDAGFTVLGMEGLDGAFSKVKSVPSAQVAATIRKSVANHPGAQAVYILGSEWRTVDIQEELEQELGVPILNPVIARAWEIQKRLGLHWPVKGYGRLIAELP